MARLEGHAALVTGGASGLGRAIVERFRAEGARVLAFDRDAENLAALEADLGTDDLAIYCGDVRSSTDAERAVALALERFGQLDCAVGNAGIWDQWTPLDALPVEAIDSAFDELFHTNVKGYLHLAKAALPALVASDGSLIFTASNASFGPAGGGVLYTATKHAVVGLIRQLAFEFAPSVRVNGVAPGPIETSLRGPAVLGLEDQPIGDLDLAMRAIPGLPLALLPPASDYTGPYVMLASRSENRAATGGVITLDAGIAIRGIGRTAGGARLAAKYRAGAGHQE